MSIERFRKIGFVILILELTMLLQIRVVNKKNSHSSTGNAEIHQLILHVPKITISEATQRHDNYTDWLIK